MSDDVMDIDEARSDGGRIEIRLVRDGQAMSLVAPASEWERLRKLNLHSEESIVITGTSGEKVRVRASDIFTTAFMDEQAWERVQQERQDHHEKEKLKKMVQNLRMQNKRLQAKIQQASSGVVPPGSGGLGGPKGPGH